MPVTVGGYVESYYAVNLALPTDRTINLRAFDARDRSFTLENAAVSVKADEGPLSATVVLQAGDTPALEYSAADAPRWQHVQQASVAYTTHGAVIDAGIFPSPIGPEVIPIKDNWSWSHSDLFYALPTYHAGARVAYPLGGGWIGQLHVYNGWNDVADTNPYPSVGVSAAYTDGPTAAQVLYFGGVERADGAPEGRPWRHLLDAYVSTPVTGEVSLLAHADAGFERDPGGTSGWLGAAATGKVQLDKQLYAAARVDLLREWVAPGATSILLPTGWIGSVTATFAVQPVDTLSVRLEVRHDQAKTAVFDTDRHSRDTVLVGAVASF